jgi:hypothetical protein
MGVLSFVMTFMQSFLARLFIAPCREQAFIFLLILAFSMTLFRARKLKAEGLSRLGSKAREILEETCIPSQSLSIHTERRTKRKREEKRRLFLGGEGILKTETIQKVDTAGIV